MKYQPQLDKSAPKPEAGGKWTREMDWEIARGVLDWQSEPFIHRTASAALEELKGQSPYYSTDLEAVVRAAEKWCKATTERINSGLRWSLSSKVCCLGMFTAHVSGGNHMEGPTPALALAKALYAAIQAEKPPTFGGLPLTPALAPFAPYMRYGCDARTGGPSMGIERDPLPRAAANWSGRG